MARASPLARGPRGAAPTGKGTCPCHPNSELRSITSGHRRTGLTLVEVVAGLALLSTLLVAVLTTKARATRQWASAHRRVEAVSAADRLLAAWWQDVDSFPRRASGRVPGDAAFVWRTAPIANPDLKALSASVIRLEILDGGNVLAWAEVVLDDDRPRNADSIASGGSP
jgi:type II secretory pathway pseudopilin PulG